MSTATAQAGWILTGTRRAVATTGSESGKPLRAVQTFFARQSLWLGAVAAGGAPLAAAFLATASGVGRVLLIVLAVVLALVGFGVPAAKSRTAEDATLRAEEREQQADQRAQQAEEDAVDADRAMREALGDALLPTLSYVVTSLDPERREERGTTTAEAVLMVLEAAGRLCGPMGLRRTRACWFRLREDGQRRLEPTRHVGRGSRPSTTFFLDQPRGQALEQLIRADRTELWSDLDAETPPDWIGGNKRRDYRTVMVVPVRSDTAAYGLLTVDAAEPNVLTDADVNLVRVLAWIVALAYSQCADSGESGQSEG